MNSAVHIIRRWQHRHSSINNTIVVQAFTNEMQHITLGVPVYEAAHRQVRGRGRGQETYNECQSTDSVQSSAEHSVKYEVFLVAHTVGGRGNGGKSAGGYPTDSYSQALQHRKWLREVLKAGNTVSIDGNSPKCPKMLATAMT